MTSRATPLERPGFDRRMTREEINACPVQIFGGPVYIIRSQAELRQAAGELAREDLLGFDTESRPSFTKGESYPPSLLQLAGGSAVYLFQLKHLGFPGELGEILASHRIIKAGVSLERDLKELQLLGSFCQAGFVDVGSIAKQAGIKNHGLRGLAAVLLGFRISKRAQTSNWARETLTPDQVQYAATDAWVSREIYVSMQERDIVPTKDIRHEAAH